MAKAVFGQCRPAWLYALNGSAHNPMLKRRSFVTSPSKTTLGVFSLVPNERKSQTSKSIIFEGLAGAKARAFPKKEYF